MTIKYKCLYEITGRIEDVNTFLVPLQDLPKEQATQHWSDCAVHNEPAYPKGECDCGGYKPEQEPALGGHDVFFPVGITRPTEEEVSRKPEQVWVEGYGENASGYVKAQPEQEPENRCVRELREFAKSNQGAYIFPSWDGHRVLKYLGNTTPPQRKPLTDEQKQLKFVKWGLIPANQSWQIQDWFYAGIAYAEAAHGIKE